MDCKPERAASVAALDDGFDPGRDPVLSRGEGTSCWRWVVGSPGRVGYMGSGWVVGCYRRGKVLRLELLTLQEDILWVGSFDFSFCTRK